MNVDLRSSVANKGTLVSKIIHFVGGQKRTLHGVRTETIQEGSFCKFELEDGRYILIRTDSVLMIEVFAPK